jgi:VWFA-related protein
MRNKLGPSVIAIRQFLLESAPSDEFFLVAASDRPTLITRFVTDPEDILRKLSSLHPEGFTALNDAIVMGVHQMKSAKNGRRALVVLVDGYDNNSDTTPSELRNLVMESDVRIYAISVVQRSYLDKLAALTGGRTVWPHDLTELPDAIESLSRELRHHYVIGYSPKNQHNDGKYRTVRVELEQSLRQQEWNVSWRHGYKAPQGR